MDWMYHGDGGKAMHEKEERKTYVYVNKVTFSYALNQVLYIIQTISFIFQMVFLISQ